MTDYVQGTTQSLVALFYSSPGVPVAVSNLSLSVISLSDASVVLGPVTTGFLNPSTGAYIYQWAIPIGLPTGEYMVSWTGDVGGVPIEASETITVVAQGAGEFVAGPCEIWPIRWPANCEALVTATPEITGLAAQAASEMLYMLSGQRFSECPTTLRPCREECYGYGWPGWASWWRYGTYPQPYWNNGTWYNMGCGQCTSGCSCTAISETLLPGPVSSVVEVKVDGVVLVSGVDYRVDDYRKLVRLGDVWPYCNDLNLADTEVGTWSATVVFGEPVPVLGQLAAGELACSFLDFFLGNDCELPNGITDLTRQGISMSFANTSNDLLQIFARFPITYMFLKTFNPNGLMARAKAYNLDGATYRAVGTA